ncbi:aminotransferase class V-fold PLP-dependent enzyme [Xanthomonas sp. AmX2]|uniref:aminotransferase class V-fold PLP-dependent enzyme n=1 Tax=Xanthomonas sp. TaxID=29446 RepID=UPI00197F09AC|nr:aminotransferase class V-fold PLP-dependent enzyme [Xanthomonas sp.]MBN6149172.1 aminotransferase class V-fold PLP-dependent enzyme [Xanthomonas sp.]
MDRNRRALLGAGLLLPATGLAVAARAADGAIPALPATTLPPEQLAGDEAYWSAVAGQYDITGEVNHLENGYWGAMGRQVLAAYQRHSAEVNRGNAWYGRVQYPPQYLAARATAAAMLGVGEDEIAFTRGATEALQALIGGYNRLRPGDAVLHADIDYDSMIAAMRWLGPRRQVQVHRIALPDVPTHQQILDAYQAAFERVPRLKLVLLTQVSHRHGLVIPVAQIAQMARARGIDAIVDAAHGFGQLDYRVPDLQADFVGINLHKWIGAPVGVGALYIRNGRVQDIDPYMGNDDSGKADSRVHTGTSNFAAYLAVPEAIDLHQRIGAARKQARLRLLRNRWTDAARRMPHLEVLASPDPRLTSAIASFRLRGRATPEDNRTLQKTLLERYRIFTTARDALDSGSCVRVTPAVFTSVRQIDALVEALSQLG